MNIPRLREILLLGLVSAISLGGYILSSYQSAGLGFPLDDAWIHQGYARNFALNGEWAFIPGEPSGGSTSPLWGFLLVIGYWLGLNPLVWTFLVGWLVLWGLGLSGMVLFRSIAPKEVVFTIWVGLALTLEWHLVWAAGSGMETLLFALIVVISFLLMMNPPGQAERWWVLVGVLVGLGVWLRPDGITLLGPAFWCIYFHSRSLKQMSRSAMWVILGFMIVFGLYLGFNQVVAGSVWPNTFYAKQAEYAELLAIPFAVRLLHQLLLPVVGIGAVLLPGLGLFMVEIIRRRKFEGLSLLLWVGGYLCLYALRLPVTYQHGRYVIPVMPIYFVVGFAGMANWIQLDAERLSQRVIMKSWIGTACIVLLGFWILGASAYAKDVAFIEGEMVSVARWLSENTPDDALIAVHDIGAIGYFSGRELVDLAGLVSPQVIPFIRDEGRLARYLDTQNVDYLVTFPDWYPSLVLNGELVFQTDSPVSPSLGGDNMAVYRWLAP